MSDRPARRGRPPKSDRAATRDRLLDAASAACADRGFDGATLAEIARRAGVTATAVYNHFASREDLLYAAGVRGLRRMTDAARGSPGSGFREVALAYCRPEMAQTRRLLAELHLAGRRDPRLAALLAEWHVTEAEALASRLDDDPEPMATVKTLFLMLLGLCHLDDLDAVEADPDAMLERVSRLAESLRRSPPGRDRPLGHRDGR